MAEETGKKQYILHYSLKPDFATEEELHKNRDIINAHIQEAGGQIEASMCQESIKKLAYPIDKLDRVYICESVFTIEPQSIKQLSESLKHEATIVRSMLEAKKLKKLKKLSSRKSLVRPQQEIEKLQTPAPALVNDQESSVTAPQDATQKTEEREKISIEELDKKLEEIIKNI